MDETLDTLLQPREGPEVGHLDHPAFYVVPEIIAISDGLPRVWGKLFQAEGESLLILIDAEHFDLDLLALPEHLGGVLDLRPGKVGDVDEPIDPFFDAYEGPEIGQIAHPPLDQFADRIPLFDGLPWIGLGLLDAEGYAPPLPIDVENYGFDNLPYRYDLGGVADAFVPAHLADVDEPFDPLLQLHKGPVIGDGDHLASDPVAHGVLGVDVIPRVGLQLLIAKADTLPLRVELEHHHLDRVPDCE